MWRSESELFALMRERLFTAVVGDILDQFGFRHQFLPQAIRPLRDDMIIAGRAMTVLEQDLDEDEQPGKPFGLMFEALDHLKAHEVYVASGREPIGYAMWGELMSSRARHLNAAGAVLNGPSRDTRCIRDMNFPVFSTGPYALDQKVRGKVVGYRVPIEIDRVRIEPGDVIFGDIDGVVVVPRVAEQETIRLALEKVSSENVVRNAIEGGMSAAEAFDKYKVM